MKTKQKVYDVSDHPINGKYRVTFGGSLSYEEATEKMNQANGSQANNAANTKPAASKTVSFDDIESGLGIGGYGSDDYSIKTESRPASFKRGRVCRVCHQSEADGAMFTTYGDSSLCDDCGG